MLQEYVPLSDAFNFLNLSLPSGDIMTASLLLIAMSLLFLHLKSLLGKGGTASETHSKVASSPSKTFKDFGVTFCGPGTKKISKRIQNAYIIR